jgi:hypothetical protein
MDQIISIFIETVAIAAGGMLRDHSLLADDWLT